MLCNRWKRWRDNGAFARIMVSLATERTEHEIIMTDVIGLASSVRVCPREYLKAHRTASGLCVKKRGAGARSGAPKVA